MFKNILICFGLFLFSCNFLVFAQENQVVEKDMKAFLAYQKNVIKIKNGIWQIQNDFRKLAKIERWPSEKLDKNIQMAEDLRGGLSYEFKGLEDYEGDQFAKDFKLAELILEKVENVESEVKSLLDSHENMNVLFKDIDILIRKANNQVRQLYRTQKTIDDIYRSKRDNTQIKSDLLSLGFLEKRVRTQNTLREISRIKLDVEDIKKTRKNNFPLFKHTYKEYNIRESEEKLGALKKELTDIIDRLERDLEDDAVTKKAIFLL